MDGTGGGIACLEEMRDECILRCKTSMDRYRLDVDGNEVLINAVYVEWSHLAQNIV